MHSWITFGFCVSIPAAVSDLGLSPSRPFRLYLDRHSPGHQPILGRRGSSRVNTPGFGLLLILLLLLPLSPICQRLSFSVLPVSFILPATTDLQSNQPIQVESANHSPCCSRLTPSSPRYPSRYNRHCPALTSHTQLSLYDIVNTPGVAADLSHINTQSKVQGFLPPDDGLKKSLTGADLVVIPAGVPRKPGVSGVLPKPSTFTLIITYLLDDKVRMTTRYDDDYTDIHHDFRDDLFKV